MINTIYGTVKENSNPPCIEIKINEKPRIAVLKWDDSVIESGILATKIIDFLSKELNLTVLDNEL